MAADASTTRPISNGPTDPSQRNSSVESESRTAVDVEEPTPSPVHTSSTIKSRWRMGILNVPDATDVPGSVFLIVDKDEHDKKASRSVPPSTTTKTTSDGSIILNPQPEDSKNDPLNWPLWQRDISLLSLGIYCMVGGGNNPILAAGFTNVAATYNVTTPKVALTTGLCMMGMGVGSVIASPLAIMFGKRPIYLASAILFAAASLWCALSPTYISLLLARIIQGMVLAPIECLPSASISEIFFLHERAFKIGVYTLLLLGGKNLVPLVSAVIIQRFGWRWVFGTLAIISIVCFILMFLFTPESYWDRASSHIGAVKSVNPKMHHGVLEPVAPEIDRTDDTSSTQDADNKSSPEFVTGRKSSIAGLEDETRSYTDSLRLKPQLSFLQRLKPYNGRLRTDGFLQALLRPFVLFAYPAVLWSAVVYSCSVGWLIVLSESVAEIYRHSNTYNFSALATGLIYISPFVGGVLGSVLAGKISDLVVRYMAKKNGGLFEPEFRLILSIPVLFTTVIGLMGFGWSAEQHDHWIVPTMFFGIISFGCSLGSTTAITFVVDSYRQYASEALVTLNFSKNVFHGLVFSLFVNRWLEHSGSKMVFIWLGVIQLIVMISTIPMYIFGKRARMWTLRKNFMRNL